MNCYVCTTEGRTSAAVATCTHCSCGLCLDHLNGTTFDPVRGGMSFACSHDTWTHSVARTAHGPDTHGLGSSTSSGK